MGYEIKPVGTLVLRTYKSNMIVAMGQLQNFEIVQSGDGTYYYIADLKSLEIFDLENIGRLKEFDEEKISDWTEIQDKG